VGVSFVQVYTLERALHVADQRQRDAYSLVIDLRGLGYHNTPPLHAIQKVRRGSGAS
jgi:hypothetical protein